MMQPEGGGIDSASRCAMRSVGAVTGERALAGLETTGSAR
jgi:hypothetical protein